MANEYCTLTNFKTYGRIDSTDTADDTFISGLIESVSRGIDSFTGRKFFSHIETRHYDVPDYNISTQTAPGYLQGRVLFLDDDILSVSTLTNGDGTTIAASEFQLLPLNEGGKRQIRIKPSSSVTFETDSSGNWEGALAVAGVWGYVSGSPSVTGGWAGSASDAFSVETMARLELATKIIANDTYKKRTGQMGEGVATLTAAGVVIRPSGWPREATDLLLPLRWIGMVG